MTEFSKTSRGSAASSLEYAQEVESRHCFRNLEPMEKDRHWLKPFAWWLSVAGLVGVVIMFWGVPLYCSNAGTVC